LILFLLSILGDDDKFLSFRKQVSSRACFTNLASC